MLICENYFPQNISKKAIRENNTLLNAIFFDSRKLICVKITSFQVGSFKRLFEQDCHCNSVWQLN